jgi:hypothetical protein
LKASTYRTAREASAPRGFRAHTDAAAAAAHEVLTRAVATVGDVFVAAHSPAAFYGGLCVGRDCPRE